MSARTLTTRYVDAIEAPRTGGRLEVFDAATPGLALRVTDRGVKSWSIFYRVDGRLRRHTIGRYPQIGIRAARARAAEALELAGAGKDPRQEEARQAALETARRGETVRSVGEAFIAGYAVDRPRWPDLEAITRNEIIGAWHDRPIGEIMRRDAADLLGAIKRQAPVRANRVLTVMRLLFKWAVGQGYVAGSPVVGLDMPTRELRRDRVLSHQEIRAFWLATGRFEAPYGAICRLLLLTAQRKSDIVDLAWTEFDQAERLIEIDGARYKGGRPHIVPLSAPALTIIAELPRLEGFQLMFPAAKATHVSAPGDRSHLHDPRPAQGFSKWKARLDRMMEEELRRDPKHGSFLPWRLHDLRRTARTEMSRIGVDKDTAERVLGHAMDDLRARYDKFDYLPQKRAALERLADHIMSLVAAPADGWPRI